jgi:hypothetical protein
MLHGDFNFVMYDVRNRKGNGLNISAAIAFNLGSDSSYNPECTEEYPSDPVYLEVSQKCVRASKSDVVTTSTPTFP